MKNNNTDEVAVRKLTPEQQFNYMDKLVNMVIDGVAPSLLIFGDAGTGKSYRVRDRFIKKMKVEHIDYVFVKGHSSAMGLYTVLHENKNSIVVFDDCDAVFKDPVSTNILKGALDSYGRRTVSWISKSVSDAGLPTSFDFQGAVVFISNLNESDVDAAVRSRSLCINISLTRQEMLDVMKSILPLVETKSSVQDKEEVLDYLMGIVDKLPQFNLRTLIKGIRLRRNNSDWREMLELFA